MANASQHESHMLDKVFDKLEEVLELFQPTSPTLIKSLPGPSNLFFDQELERAMDQHDTRERHNLPKVLEPTLLKVASESAPCPRAFRGRYACTSPPTCLGSEVAGMKPFSSDHQDWRGMSINRTPSGHNQVTADETLRHLNEAGAQDPLDEWPTHDNLPMEASRFSRAQGMSLPTSLDSITTPSAPKNQIGGSDHQIQRAFSTPTHMPVKDSPSSVASLAQTPSPQPCSCPRKTSASRILGSVRGKYLTVKAHIKFYFDVSAHYGVRTRW
jgi:hypothetical protein